MRSESDTNAIAVEGCDTIPKLFWHQVKARGGRTAFREKHLGIWRATSWHDYGERAKWAGLGLVQLGLAARRRRVDPGRDDARVAVRRHGHHWAPAASRTASIRPIPPSRSSTSSTTAARASSSSRTTSSSTSSSRCASAARTVAKVFVFDMEGLSRLQRPAGHAVRRAPGARPRLRRRSIPDAGTSWSPPRKADDAGDPGLHLRHHRSRQGRDAVATATSSSRSPTPMPSSRSATTTSSSPSCRSATSPSAPSPSSCRCAPAPSPTSPRASRPCRRTCARWRPPLLRRAAHLGALLLRHRHPHEGGDLDRPHRLRLGDRHRPQGRRAAAARAARRRPAWRCSIGVADFAGARQHQARHRHAPRALRRHRRRADRARPDQMVPRARHRHARGLRPDRELRPGDRHARPHQARHRGRRGAAHRGQDLAGGRDPAPGPARLHGLPATSRTRRQRRCATAGCIPATSASSTTRATSRSPTA